MLLWFDGIAKTTITEGLARDYFVCARAFGSDSSNDSIRGLLVRDGASVTVPEPASLSLVGLALVGVAALRRRRA